MSSRKNICVFLSSRNISPLATENIYNFGKKLSKNSFNLVFGGADQPGLMRQLALGIYDGGGNSTSVIPTCFGWDITKEIDKVTTVDNMGERKHTMMEMSDAFVVLQGGLGTLDELMEVWTIKLMGGHNKPILIFTSPSYKAALIQLFQVMVEEGTAKQEHLDALEWCHSYDDIIQSLKSTFS